MLVRQRGGSELGIMAPQSISVVKFHYCNEFGQQGFNVLSISACTCLLTANALSVS
jgi:hypothetical protein